MLKGAITEATTATPTTPAADWVLVLQQCRRRFAQVPHLAVTDWCDQHWDDSSANVRFCFTWTCSYNNRHIHVSLKNQTGNKVLAAPADGSSSAPIFRAINASGLQTR